MNKEQYDIIEDLLSAAQDVYEAAFNYHVEKRVFGPIFMSRHKVVYETFQKALGIDHEETYKYFNYPIASAIYRALEDELEKDFKIVKEAYLEWAKTIDPKYGVITEITSIEEIADSYKTFLENVEKAEDDEWDEWNDLENVYEGMLGTLMMFLLHHVPREEVLEWAKEFGPQQEVKEEDKEEVTEETFDNSKERVQLFEKYQNKEITTFDYLYEVNTLFNNSVREILGKGKAGEIVEFEKELADLLLEKLNLEDYKDVPKKTHSSVVLNNILEDKEAHEKAKEVIFNLYKEFVKENLSDYVDGEIKSIKEQLEEFESFMDKLSKLSSEENPELFAAWLKYQTLLAIVIGYLEAEADPWELDELMFGEEL